LADDLPPLCRNVKKMGGLNLPGTPWATSACRGRPLLYFYLSIYLSEMNCLASLLLGAGVSTSEDISRKLLRNSCSVRYDSVYTARAGLPYRASARVRRVDYFIRGRHQNSVGRRKTFPALLSSC